MTFSKLSFKAVLTLSMLYSSYHLEKAGNVSKNHSTENTVLLQARFMMERGVFCTWEFFSGFPKVWVLWATNNPCDLLSTYCVLGTLHILALRALRALCIFHCNSTHSPNLYLLYE